MKSKCLQIEREVEIVYYRSCRFAFIKPKNWGRVFSLLRNGTEY